MTRYPDVLCSLAAPPAAGPPATATLAVATTAALALVRGRLALLPCDLFGLPHGIDQRIGDAAVLDLAGEWAMHISVNVPYCHGCSTRAASRTAPRSVRSAHAHAPRTHTHRTRLVHIAQRNVHKVVASNQVPVERLAILELHELLPVSTRTRASARHAPWAYPAPH